MQCDCGKKFLAAVAVFAFKVVSGMVLCGGIFSWVYKLEPVNVWRPIIAPGKRFYIGTFIASLLFVAVYKLVSRAFEGGALKKGLLYGACVWAVGIIPGMVATYTFMTVNTTVVVYWTLSSLPLLLIEGIIVALIVKDTGAACCMKPGSKC